jgi:hypothetical protein
MEPVTIATISSGFGAWSVTLGILIVLKGQLGPYWSDLLNRIASLVIPIALVEVAIVASVSITGTSVPWWIYIIGVLNGLLASKATSSSQQSYDLRQKQRVLGR